VDAKLAAGVGDVLGAIGQRKGAGACNGLLGITRQIEGRELGCGLRRDADAADPGRHKTIATFETPRKGIGIELRAELTGAGYGHGAIGGDVLPAIGE
jgi:hypothetical protein